MSRNGDDLDGLRVGARVYRKRLTEEGHPSFAWEQDMPRIHPHYLDCAVYLYPTVQAAEMGEALGGSGFLVSIASTYRDGTVHYYVVTNQHVAIHARAARFNTQNGQTSVVRIAQEEWIEHPQGDDLAVYMIDLDQNYQNYKSIGVDLFVTKPLMETLALGPGDDVFWVGRYVQHDGKQRNDPTARFGRIAQMPGEPIRQPLRGFNQESFVVDIPSIGGYSGSPVFLFPMKERLGIPIAQPWLLGINWGHLNASYEPVYRWDEDKREHVRTEYAILTHAGVAGIVPAWKLRELLDDESLASERRRIDERRFQAREQARGGTLDDA